MPLHPEALARADLAATLAYKTKWHELSEQDLWPAMLMAAIKSYLSDREVKLAAYKAAKDSNGVMATGAAVLRAIGGE